jgi:hypothetical protein
LSDGGATPMGEHMTRLALQRIAVVKRFIPPHFPILLVSMALTGIFFDLTGWLAEDAYINFRVVENIVSGNGPVSMFKIRC